MSIFTFLADLNIFTMFGISVFWGVATYAFAGWARFEKDWVWGIGGAFFPLFAFGICIVMWLSDRGGQEIAVAREYQNSEDLW
jgi:hypothetical protein